MGAWRVIRLSDDQRRIVECPHDGGHLLVLAGPGSGKTRVICERIGYLLREGLADADQILPLAFTHRAGAELQNRLAVANHPTVTAGTIHSLCADLVNRFGRAIGIKPPLRIADSERQRDVLRRAVAEIFGRPIAEVALNQILAAISLRKRTGADIWDAWKGRPFPGDLMRLIDDAYCGILAADGLLNFDDLISSAIRLLDEDEPTATIVRNRWRFVFVDEFHDLSPEQYHLLGLLAPFHAPDRQVMSVADTQQAIYAFRGADAVRLIDRYTRDYRPHVHRLTVNYRSTEQIVRAAGRLMPKDGAVVVNPPGQEVTCYGCKTAQDEADRVANWIERARATGQYDYADIAILFRTHRRADLIEQTLLAGGVPLRRVQQNRFFNDPDVREALRYLDLIAAMRDGEFVSALNWPRVLVDEVTMIHLRRLAAAEGLPLSTLAARPDLLRGRASPLTRIAIEEFMATVAAELLPVADRPIDQISERLLAILSRRRDPVPRDRRAELSDTLTYLGRGLDPAVAALDAALARHQPIQIIPDEDVDCHAAALILRSVCERYFDQAAVAARQIPPPDAFVIRLGQDEPVTEAGFGLGPFSTRTVTFGVAARAWRLGQLLLMRHEPDGLDRFVVLDLETTSTHAHTTEILEIAALRFDAVHDTPDCFTSLVRPRGPSSLTAASRDVHGLTWAALKDAPGPGDILPHLLAFLGDDIIVGHFADAFDGQIVRRVARELGLTPPANPVLDTCTLAQRLLPDAAHGLQALAQLYDVSVVQTHRADADATLTAAVLRELLAELRRDKERGALAEALPLVALGTVAAGLPLTADNALLVEFGARAIRFGQGSPLLDQLRTTCGASIIEPCLMIVLNVDGEPTNDDVRWNKMLARWREAIAGYCRTTIDQSLTAFLHFAALADAADLLTDEGGRVTMMTIHSAKGNEWPLVFLIGLEDGQLPDWRANDPAEVEEERRVLYVGMTRAQRRLCLSWAADVDERSKLPSRVLCELPGGLVTYRGLRVDSQRSGQEKTTAMASES
jgi:superfamily I DNA/RNA helicase/DNA polymerase III epsilon subunit-like protein